MKLKAKVQSLDGIPEEYHGLYTKVGDDFVLDVDDAEYKQRLAEFRTNNIEGRRKLEEMQRKLEAFGGVNPDDLESLKEAQRKLQELEEKKLISEGELEKVLERRTERMRQEYEGKIEQLTGQVTTLSTERETFKSKLAENQLASTILGAITEVGVPRKGAARDILSRAGDVWQIDDTGELRPVRDGKLVYGRDGTNPLTPQEWAQGLAKEASWLFEPSAGGGARGGAAPSNGQGGVVQWGDSDALGANLEAIAEGRVTVER